jgi:hypothetical protein
MFSMYLSNMNHSGEESMIWFGGYDATFITGLSIYQGFSPADIHN